MNLAPIPCTATDPTDDQADDQADDLADDLAALARAVQADTPLMNVALARAGTLHEGYFIRGVDLRRMRERLGLTGAELGKRIGYSRAQVSNWELGNCRVPLSAWRLVRDELAHERDDQRDWDRLQAELGLAVALRRTVQEV